MLKRKRISDVKIPDTVGGARALERKLKDCSVDLGSSESANLHGYRLELLCKGRKPASALEENIQLLDQSWWIRTGAISARSVLVTRYLDGIERALSEFRRLEVARGDDNDKISKLRKHIITDLLNFFGLSRATMLQYLRITGFENSPFPLSELWRSNEPSLRLRVTRPGPSRRVVRRANTAYPAGRNRNNLRIHENGFTESEDELILTNGDLPQHRNKWKNFRRNHRRFRNRTSDQLRQRFKWLRSSRNPANRPE